MVERRKKLNESVNLKQKLIVTIIKKGTAKKIVKASKEAGAEGATIVMGTGTGIHEAKMLFFIDVEPEKEIVLTLITEKILDKVLDAIITVSKLNKPGNGIAFVIDVKKLAGCMHMSGKTHREVTGMDYIKHDLIITIVNKGNSKNVVEASKKAGAEGGTLLYGRGTGIQHAKLFGITIEPEKEIVLTLIKREICEKVLNAIVEATDLNKPGKGIAFVLEVEKVVGINHLLDQITDKAVD
jgi:nitrogen regulatory protein PII